MAGGGGEPEGEFVIPVVGVDADDRLAVLIIEKGVFHPFVVPGVLREINNEEGGIVHALLLVIEAGEIGGYVRLIPDADAALHQMLEQRENSFAVLFRETKIQIRISALVGRAFATEFAHSSGNLSWRNHFAVLLL